MPRENAAAKGRRYLTEGRVVVLRVSQGDVFARVRGDGAIWQVGWSRNWGWSCTCPARGRCAHLLAVGLVVAVDADRGRR
jgi:uncharacterized Zn finger protein